MEMMIVTIVLKTVMRIVLKEIANLKDLKKWKLMILRCRLISLNNKISWRNKQSTNILQNLHVIKSKLKMIQAQWKRRKKYLNS